jgi:heterodisulfide reductase subunit C
METKSKIEPLAQPLKEKILNEINEQVMKCYQCGKCAAGCPLSGEMDYTPNQILRLLQIGDTSCDDEVLRSYGIWLCLTCDTVIAVVRKKLIFHTLWISFVPNLSNEGKFILKLKKLSRSHRSFLESIEKQGGSTRLGLSLIQT